MKKIQFILLFTLSIIILSCSNDDNASNNPELTIANISGTYNLIAFESIESITTSLISGDTTRTTESVGDNFTEDSNIMLNLDGTFTEFFDFSTISTTTIDQEDDTSEVNINFDSNSDSGTYSVNEGNQTITLNGSVYNVLFFSNNELIIGFSDIDEISNNEILMITEEWSFTKQ